MQQKNLRIKINSDIYEKYKEVCEKKNLFLVGTNEEIFKNAILNFIFSSKEDMKNNLEEQFYYELEKEKTSYEVDENGYPIEPDDID